MSDVYAKLNGSGNSMGWRMARADRIMQDIVHEKGLMRSKDLVARGISPNWVNVMPFGPIKFARGIYGYGDKPSAMVLACARVPRGVLCLESALSFHGLGSGEEKDIWMAIAHRAHQPRTSELPI